MKRTRNARRERCRKAYQDARDTATELLARISTGLDADSDQGITWGHVGDISAIVGTLQELSDRILGEGEYGSPETNCHQCDRRYSDINQHAGNHTCGICWAGNHNRGTAYRSDGTPIKVSVPE